MQADPSPGVLGPDGRAHHVLVVDDNPAKRYTIGRLLRAAGFEVSEAASGQDALERAADGPDAIVLDVNLPDINGFEVCRMLRARERTARTPILHLSATFMDAEDKVSGLDAGADGYLTHPVEPPVLVATVRAFIRARQAEEEMRRSEAKFRAVFDNSANGIALFDDNRIILEANPAMAAFLGMPIASLVGESWGRFVPPGDADLSVERFASLRANRSWAGTAMLLRPDGRALHIEGNITEHANSKAWIAIFSDITQRIGAEAERERLYASERAARTEAERANRLKDEFLATISHELRAPLQSVVGWSQLLSTRAPSDIESYRSGIEAIDRSARMLAQLISDLLDVSRITSGKLRLERRELDIAESIAHALDGVGQSAIARHLSIQTRLDDGDLRVLGDPGRIQQVLGNLLTNAIKFTPTGGRVLVEAGTRDDIVEVSISDTGQGIGAEFLPHIFDAFRQEDAATTRRHEGLGLGLSIVKRILEMHDGQALASSPGIGKGSTFTIRLPTLAAARAMQAQSGAPDRSQVDLRGLRVLLVDDDPDARRVVRRLLDDHAVVSFEAASVAEALAAVRAHEPQLLISDISMPGDDGYALVKRLREAGYDAEHLPAIALTAFARPEDKLRALSSGFQIHLGKPIDLESLLAAIRSLHPAGTH